MTILGIETSCDETAAAIVELNDREQGAILRSNVVLSSMDLHAAYGGIVPEIAARSHIESIMPVIERSISEAFRKAPAIENTKTDPWDQIDGIAVTYGAGLGGSLLVGVLAARTLAITKNKPLYGINHVEGHIYANFIIQQAVLPQNEGLENTKSISSRQDSLVLSGYSYSLPPATPQFPMLGLIVSGGHSQLVIWHGHFDFVLLGQTMDDAIGEAFDKVAKILGLPYPGGPSVGKKAQAGDAHAFKLPKAKMPGKYDFSFSGLKTAVLRLAQQQIGEDYTFPSSGLAERLSEAQKANIAASFQRTAIETVVDKTLLAYEEFQPKSVVIGGGVAASPELRRQLADRLPIKINYSDPKLMTDNGAMIAALGCYKASLGQPKSDPYRLGIEPNLSM